MMSVESKPSVLVVDDSEMDLEIISIVCAALGCTVELASDAFQALERYKEKKHDLVLTDYMMDPMNGIYVVSRIKEMQPDATCLMVTGFPDGSVRRLAEDGIVFDLITKPIQAAELKETLRLALNQTKGATQKVSGIALSNRMDTCPLLVGDAMEVRRLRDRVAHVIMSQEPVLLTGSSEATKRELAGFIHQNGPNANKPIIEIACASGNEASLRADLIAVGGEWGRLLKEAEGGTLILDSVLSLPLPVQEDLAAGFDQVAKRMHVIGLSDDSLDDALEAGKIEDNFYFKVTMEQIRLPD